MKRRARRVKPIPLTIGNDPSLWRFSSRDEAIRANVDLIADLIRASQPVSSAGETGNGETDLDDIAAR
ncbi:MAG: hypothetical protein HY866_22960 [Chloroflexi bacterium]|nr:hypothetical protein [Chloroflexota bacterium]